MRDCAPGATGPLTPAFWRDCVGVEIGESVQPDFGGAQRVAASSASARHAATFFDLPKRFCKHTLGHHFEGNCSPGQASPEGGQHHGIARLQTALLARFAQGQ